MAFGADRVHSMSVVIGDPGATTKKIALWRVPTETPIEILRAYIVAQNAQGAGSAGNFALHNFGTAGTSVIASGTIAAALGGTATAARLSANTPSAYTISDGTMTAGQWLYCAYTETGDFVEGNVTIAWDYVIGIGA